MEPRSKDLIEAIDELGLSMSNKMHGQNRTLDPDGGYQTKAGESFQTLLPNQQVELSETKQSAAPQQRQPSDESTGPGSDDLELKPDNAPKQWTNADDEVKSQRHFKINMPQVSQQQAEQEQFTKNRISTTKYSCLTFLPLNLFEQFTKMANAYFLLIMILQLIPGLASKLDWLFTLLPLTLVVGVSMLKDVYEDNKRRKKDREENERVALVCPQGEDFYQQIMSEQIEVGCLVKVHKDTNFPCDMILVKSELPHGVCFVETKNLDGETNLKQKMINEDLLAQLEKKDGGVAAKDDSATCRALTGASFEGDGPNEFIYQFQGNLTLDQSEQKYAVSNGGILLKGCTLRDTEWVVGVAVYTGHDTKIMKNSSNAVVKRSKNAKALNMYILICMLVQFLCSLFGAIISVAQSEGAMKEHWYLVAESGDQTSTFVKLLRELAIWFITLMNFVPISLLVTLEMINFVQAQFIMWDLQVFDETQGMAAVVQSSNLNEELGMVHYIFSDKTGTLTQNIMEFKRMSIGAEVYGTDPPNGKERHDVKYAPGVTNVNFVDDNLFKQLQDTTHAQNKKIKEFIEALGLCHTVRTAEKTTKEGQAYLAYNATSPDELALVNGARHLGFAFEGMNDDRKTVIQSWDGQQLYEHLNIIEFNSDRKRMTVFVRTPDNKIKVICKGADSIVGERLRADQKLLMQRTNGFLEDFSNQGLRTLMIASKEISESEYEQFALDYKVAETKANKDAAMDEVADAIERDFELMGSTAIDDLLQEDVGKTIYDCRSAGIQVWVLTGDKVETAINIGYSCKLLEQKMIQFILQDVTKEAITAKFLKLVKDQDIKEDNIEVVTNAKIAKKEAKRKAMRGDLPDLTKAKVDAVIVTGKCLETLNANSDLKEAFIDLCEGAKVVLACRVSPNQKADIVNWIKARNPEQNTLAIGDGANDVNMICAAHIGIGILGREGAQAARAADYSIGKFKFLKNLLFVHGRECYRRNSFATVYIFYKNILLTAPLFCYGFVSAFTGTTIYHILMYQGFNTVFTAFPILWLATMDSEHPKERLLNDPMLYKGGLYNVHFNTKVFLWWIFLSGLQATGLLSIALGDNSKSAHAQDGKLPDMTETGDFIFCSIVLIANIKILVHSFQMGLGNLLLVFGSIAVYVLALIIVSFTMPTFEHFGSFQKMAGTASFWLGQLLFVFTFSTLDRVWYFWHEGRKTRILNRKLEQESIRASIELVKRQNMQGKGNNYFRHRGFAFDQDPGSNTLFSARSAAREAVNKKLTQIGDQYGF